MFWSAALRALAGTVLLWPSRFTCSFWSLKSDPTSPTHNNLKHSAVDCGVCGQRLRLLVTESGNRCSELLQWVWGLLASSTPGDRTPHPSSERKRPQYPPQYSYRTDAGAVFLSDSSLLWMNTKSMNVSALLDVMNTLLEKRLTVRNLFLKLLFIADSL